MSSIQTTSLIKANKNFIVGYFQSKYHSNAWSFMNNKTQVLKRSIHGAAHIRVVPSNSQEELKRGLNVTQYYYITASTIKYGNQGWHLSLRQDLLNCISVSDVPAENYHFLVLLDKMALDITYSELKKMSHKCMYNQMHQVCLLYELDESKYFSKSIYKPTFTNVKYDSSKPFAYYEPNFNPEKGISDVKYTSKYFKGLYCIDLYDENNNLIKEEVIKGVNMADLWNNLKKAAGDSTQLDCSSDKILRDKFRGGRAVKLTNKDSKDVLLGRIRQLEKRVEYLEGENKQLKVRVEKVEKAVVELKETKADKAEVVKKEDLLAFKNWVIKYCAKDKNKLTKDVVEKEGYSDVFNYLLSKGAITRIPSDNYYFIHWNLLKAA